LLKPIETAYPWTLVLLCIVHQVRNSLKYTTWKYPKALAASLRTTCAASTQATASAALVAFTGELGAQCFTSAQPSQKGHPSYLPTS
jgi:transposase-like protein